MVSGDSLVASRVDHLVDRFYTPAGQQQTLIAILSVCVALPVIFVDVLSPIVVLAPVVLIGGVLLVRYGRPQSIPTWITFNLVSSFLIVYASYNIGTTLTPPLLVVFVLGLLIYDIVGVQIGAMQSMNRRMLLGGVPIVLLLPHSRAFTYSGFKSIVDDEGLEGLHGSDYGVTMLGIGDAVIPAALAVGASTLGVAYGLGPFTFTIPQVTTAVGGICSLVLLIKADLPRAIAALTASVPGALIGFALGLFLDPTIGLQSLIP